MGQKMKLYKASDIIIVLLITMMQLWRPEFELDGRNSGSWFRCLPIRIYHWQWDGDCTAVVCEAVCCMEV